MSEGSPRIEIRIAPELADIAPGYLANRIADLATLKDALDREDFAKVAAISHRTKGTAGGYGFHELGILAKALEIAALSKNRDEAARALELMRAHLASVEILP